MNIDKEREAFEENMCHKLVGDFNAMNNHYNELTDQLMWEAWQAAKASSILVATDKMLEAGMNCFDFPLDNARFSRVNLECAFNAMIEAGQQTLVDAPNYTEWQPDWNQAPDWATHWSHDRIGSHWWDSAPKKGLDMWIPSNSNNYKYDESPDFGYTGVWQDSLRERTETQEQDHDN